ncbi:collagen alpha-2(I) chain-like [Passer domesticus]|uniref:collagen alpha-2(I) chain-like n=1 Tax=Passer domesticus TaxID=48849 RepID=UPI0030FEFF25
MEDDSEEWAEPQEVEMGGAFPGLAEAALGALGELAENCGSALLPYLDPTLAAILDLTQFPQCQVRAAAYEALGSVCCCGREPQTAPSPVHQGALQALLRGLGADPEVGGALGAVGGVGRILQPPGHAHKEWLEPIGRALCDVITGEIACLRSRGGRRRGRDLPALRAPRDRLRLAAGAGRGHGPGGRGRHRRGRGLPAPPLPPPPPLPIGRPGRPRPPGGALLGGGRDWPAGPRPGGGGHALPAGFGPRLPIGRRRPRRRGQGQRLLRHWPDRGGRRTRPPGGGVAGGGALLPRPPARGGRGPAGSGTTRWERWCASRGRCATRYWSDWALLLLLGALPLSQDLEEEEPVLRFLLGRGPTRSSRTSPSSCAASAPPWPWDGSSPVGGADPQRFREGVASLDPAHAAILSGMLGDVIGSQ